MATLYDAHGNVVDLGRLKEEVAAPGLTSVRQIMSGHPTEGLTPRRLQRLLKASETGDAQGYLELAEEMEEKDLHYRSQLQTRKLACAGLQLVVEAHSDSKEDQKDADMLREALALEGLEDSLVDVLDGIGKGYSSTEIHWDTSGKTWTPTRLTWRDPRWFEFSPEDGTTLLLRGSGVPTPLDPFKFIVHKPKLKSGIPIRGGLARASAWAYLFANYVLKDWVGFCELFGQPLRVGKYPAGASEDQIATLQRAVSSIGSDAAAVIPEGMLIEFIKHEVHGSSDLYDRLLTKLETRVTLAVLGQTLTSGQTKGGGGSLALGKVHDEVRKDIMSADARQLAGTLRRDLAKPYLDLNRGPRAHYPKVRLLIEEPEDIKTLSEALGVLVPLGLKVEQSVVRDKLGLPDPPEGKDVDLLTPPKPSAPPAAPAQPDPPPRTAQAAHRAEAPAPDALDRLAELALADWQAQLDPMVAPILDRLEQAPDLAAFQAALLEAQASMDPTRLAQMLAQASFTARLAGAAGADLG